MDPISVVLPEPRDQIEEGERINAFWMSFAQDRVWAVVLGVPTSIFDVDGVTQIDTPWPLEMEVYERVRYQMLSVYIQAHIYETPGMALPRIADKRNIEGVSERPSDWLAI